MKELWKKIDHFMLKYGGYSLLIATIATVAFFAVLQWGNDYAKEKAGILEIKVTEDGKLSVDYNYDDKDEVYILWETDGGNIAAECKENEFPEQENSATGYYSYSHSSEKAVWNPEDADGNRYETATVRAVLYQQDKDNRYSLENYITEITITLSDKNGKVEKCEDRYFGNPVRGDSDENWSQIYCIQEDSQKATYRYRTGNKLEKEAVLIMYWDSDGNNLSETDYAKGFYPDISIKNENKDLQNIKAVQQITCIKNGDENSSCRIRAGLISETSYKQENIEASDVMYQAEIVK